MSNQDNQSRSATMIQALNKSLDVFVSYGEGNFNEVMTNGIKPVADVTGLDRVCVYRYKDIAGEKHLGMTYLWDRAHGGTAPLDERLTILPDIQGIKEWLLSIPNHTHLNTKVSELPKEKADFLSSLGIKSILMVPIYTRGDFWGIITLENHTKDEYFCDGSPEAHILQSAARLFVKAFIREEAEQEVQRIGELYRTAFNSAPIGLNIFDENFNCIDCNDIVMIMFGVTKEYYKEHFYELMPEIQPDGSKSFEKSQENFKSVMNGETVVGEWMYNTPSGELIPCEISIKRVKQGEKYVALGYVYDLRKIKKLEENIHKLEHEAEKIYFDPLTNIFNRRYFDENLARILKNLSRSESMLSMMMIDIDRFKQYNDTYGHDKGDECLKMIANCLSKTITRETDFVARYGGEEFAVVLPNTDRNGACIIAEKLLKNIINLNIIHKKNDASPVVTVSIGVTTSKVERSQTDHDYIKRSDEMLYMSKQGGRNRYTFSYL